MIEGLVSYLLGFFGKMLLEWLQQKRGEATLRDLGRTEVRAERAEADAQLQAEFARIAAQGADRQTTERALQDGKF